MIRSALFALGLIFATAVISARADVLVFAAASTKPAMDEIALNYSKNGGDTVTVSYASSGTLAQQIIAGAPADVFLSANEKWMDRVDAEGRIAPDSRQILLRNRLAVIGPAGLAFIRQPTAREYLTSVAAKGGWIAIGDPRHVPAGIYAKAALTAMGLWETLRPRLSRASDVRAAVVLVARGEAEAGIVYESDASASVHVTRISGIDPSLHPPIAYPVAVIDGHDGSNVRRYMAFLQSKTAGDIFKRHGFGLK